MLRRTLILGTAIALFSSVTLTAATAQDKVYRFGVSNFGAAAEYMHKWTTQMQNHPWVKDGKIELTVFDARFDPLTQSNQVDTMITQRFDAILIAPYDFKAGGAAVDRAAAAGIPVVGAVVAADTKNFTAFIGHDDVVSGKQVTDILAKHLGGKGNVVLLEGVTGMSSQIARTNGVNQSLKDYPDIKIIATKSANWSRAEGQATMENWLLANPGRINGVIAENDEMGLGAIEAIKAAGIDPKTIPVVAIDGIDDGLRAVEAGTMLSTLRRDVLAEGLGAMDLAIRAVVGPNYKPLSPIWGTTAEWADGTAKTYLVPYQLVNAETVASFKK